MTHLVIEEEIILGSTDPLVIKCNDEKLKFIDNNIWKI